MQWNYVCSNSQYQPEFLQRPLQKDAAEVNKHRLYNPYTPRLHERSNVYKNILVKKEEFAVSAAFYNSASFTIPPMPPCL